MNCTPYKSSFALQSDIPLGYVTLYSSRVVFCKIVLLKSCFKHVENRLAIAQHVNIREH